MYAKIAILVALLAAALAIETEPVGIVNQVSNLNPDGSFEWGYESKDGSSQHQSSHLETAGDAVAPAVEGNVHWTDKDGVAHDVIYNAGVHGVQVQGSDVPVPPPIPEAIQKSLEWIAAHPQPEEKTIKTTT